MGLGDEEESVTAEVTFTCCPLCLKPFKVGRALRAHFQSKSHALTATTSPLSLERAMNLAIASFTVTATSNYMVEQSSASVGLKSKGRPLLLDQPVDKNNEEEEEEEGRGDGSVEKKGKERTGKKEKKGKKGKKKKHHHGGDVALERARERACTKASASAAAESVRKYGSGGGDRANAKLSHDGLTVRCWCCCLLLLVAAGCCCFTCFRTFLSLSPHNNQLIDVFLFPLSFLSFLLFSPLQHHQAARDGDLSTLIQLIDSGAYNVVRDVGPNGETGYHWAAGSGHLNVLVYLVEIGGVEGLTKRDQRSGRTVVHWASRNGHLSLLAAMKERWPSSLDVRMRTYDGTTSLHLACYAGETATVEWLVGHGCDPNVCNNYGCNSIFFACIGGRYQTSKFLYEECSVDVFAIQNQGHSALHKAAYTGSRDICAWLQDVVGLDVNCTLEDAKGHTASDLARMKGYLELSLWLTRHCSSVVAGGSGGGGSGGGGGSRNGGHGGEHQRQHKKNTGTLVACTL